MARCDVCGNDYDKTFSVTQGDRTMTFDCRVIGHGVETKDTIYCCAHCAKCEGVQGVRDRAA